MDKEILTAVAIGIGLSASCGFRVFVPLLVAGIAAKAGLFPVNEGFHWLAGWPAIICFGTATVAEILAYYIPFIDNLLDSVTTPLSVAAGTLLLTSVLPIDNDMLKWTTGLLVGGGAAATIQSGSVMTRLMSSKITAGGGNAALATGEHFAAIGTSSLALVIPVLTAILLISFILFILLKLRKKLLRRNRAY